MALLLALVSALAYGLSDFIGGVVSRRATVWAVAVVVQSASTLTTAAAALFLAGSPTGSDLLWAVAAGVGSGLGVGYLFRGLADGRMGVVAPLSAVGAALVPVLVGLVLGERPGGLEVLGMVAALPGIWLVSAAHGSGDGAGHDSGDGSQPGSGIRDGIRAGAAFGLMFTALSRLSEDAGLWPIALSQAVSVLAVVFLALLYGGRWVPREPRAWSAAWAGPLSAVAVVSFQLATESGLLTVSSVLASLYPAVTILLAVVVLGERVHRPQALGLALCGAAVALVAGG
jgi:drug/metabolite transporter (DMT)-like permease